MHHENAKPAATLVSNYERKWIDVTPRQATHRVVFDSAIDLDTARTTALPVPASKFALESLCGASGAIGAM